MNKQTDYSILDSELRQSLLRGYSRLRQSQAQGAHLDEAERVLELLGDPQLLTIEHPRYGWRLAIPLIYVSSWQLQRGDRLSSTILHHIPEPVLTIYKRRHQEDESQQREIHTKLVNALRRYIVRHEERGGLLLDVHSAHRPDELDDDEIVTENWYGFHDPTKPPHWLFESTSRQDLPSQVWRVNSLVRISFPLYPKDRAYPRKMVTLVLGLTFASASNGSTFNDNTRSQMMRWVRRLADVLTTEILRLHNILESREGVERMNLVPPKWLDETERDALHLAVDDLHRRILELAGRVGVKKWDLKHQPLNNFLIAFKELNTNYQACLRYRLTIPNLHTIGAGFKNVKDWRTAVKKSLKSSRKDLHDLFFRGRSSKEQTSGQKKFLRYYDDCNQAIDKLFAASETMDGARRKIARMIETTPYRMNRTPGYFVMYLSHPEIIQSWLRDPRVRQFEEYPAELFVWENTALPPKIYYSQIADGNISVGICGVNAELLEHCPAYYELQEIIDESGSRFRYIICEDEFNQLKDELREDLKMVEGPRLWVSALRRFRRLAYYHFPNPWDYHTKLVYDKEIHALAKNSLWRKHRTNKWHELFGLREENLKILKKARHIPSSWTDVVKVRQKTAEKETFYETDFVNRYLENYLRPDFADTHPGLGEARLHRLKMKGTEENGEDTSLLVLVPDPQNNEFAKELITRFLTQCEFAYADYEKAIEFSKTYQIQPSEPDLYDVFLCYNSKDRKEIRAIHDQLKQNNLNPWWDQNIKAGRKWMPVLEQQLKKIRSAAVFVGKSEKGVFQTMEIRRILTEFSKQGRPIIPVLLKGASEEELEAVSFFLSDFQTVDFNQTDPDPMQLLIDGIRTIDDLPSRDGKTSNRSTKKQRTKSTP